MFTTRLTIKALDLSTWDAFAALVEANGGIFGGCGCTAGSSAQVAPAAV